jgi:hypothetical protein
MNVPRQLAGEGWVKQWHATKKREEGKKKKKLTLISFWLIPEAAIGCQLWEYWMISACFLADRLYIILGAE